MNSLASLGVGVAPFSGKVVEFELKGLGVLETSSSLDKIAFFSKQY